MEKIERQIDVLRSLLDVYSGKTIDNVLSQLESRLKYMKEYGKDKGQH